MYIPGQFYWLENLTSQNLEKNYIFGGEFRFELQNLTLFDDWRNSAAWSTGEPSQVKYVRYAPVVPDSICVRVSGIPWKQVDDLSQATATDKVYTVDYEEGEITFGDGVHGAIPSKGTILSASYTAKRDGFNDYYEAIKAVDPSVQVYSCFHSDKFIETMGDEYPYDGVIVHPYAQLMPPKIKMENYHENIMLEADKLMQDVLLIQTKVMNTVDPARRDQVRVMASEYGILSNNAPEPGYLGSLDHGLYVSKCLMKMMEMGLYKAHKHCLIDVAEGSTLGPGGQAVISSNPDFVESATGYAMKLMKEMSGSNRVEGYITNGPVRDTHNFKSFDKLNMISTTDDEGNVYLIVVNVDCSDDTTATIHFEDFVPSDTAEVRTLSGDSYLDYNDAGNRSRVKITTNSIAMSNDLEYTFPAHLVTAFKVTGGEEKEEVYAGDPVAMWNFNEQVGDMIQDMTKTGHDIELKKGASLEEITPENRCLKVTSDNDYAESPFVVDLNSTDMTASMWVRLDEDLGTKQIILQQGGTYGTTWLYRNINGCLASYIGGNYILSNAYMEPDTWYHVAVAKEGSSVKLYLNGALVTTGTSTVDHISTAPMYLGQHKLPTLTERDWAGAMDDLSIFDYTLTGPQIETLCQSAAPAFS